MKNWIGCLALIITALCFTSTHAEERIAWHGNLKDGLRAARLTGKPILLISAAVQCKGVSGIY